MIRSLMMQTGPGQAGNTSSALQFALGGQDADRMYGQVGANNQSWMRKPQAAGMSPRPSQLTGQDRLNYLVQRGGAGPGRASYLQRQLGAGGQQSQTGGESAVNTSISPWQIYSPADTQMNINQTAATALGGADVDFAQKPFTRPGMSRDMGTMSAAAPQIGQSLAATRAAMGFQPLADTLTNRQFQLEAEYAKAKEGIGLAEALRKLQSVKDYEYAETIQPLLNAILGS